MPTLGNWPTSVKPDPTPCSPMVRESTSIRTVSGWAYSYPSAAQSKGGEATPLPVSLKRPEVLDVSRDGTELLIGNSEGKEGYSFWIQPIAGGSPRRIGSVLGNDQSAFNLDGTGIIFGKEHDIYSVNRDGSSFRKLLATEGFPFAFRFSPDARVLRFSLFDISNFTVKIMEVSPEGVGLHKLLDGCCGDWTPDGRLFIFQKRWLDSRDDLWALPEKKGFRWRNRDDKPTQLTAGPLDFRSPVPGKNGKEVFAIGASPRVEVVRYDTRSGEFVPYLNGLSAEGLAFLLPMGSGSLYTTYPDGLLLWRSRLDGSDRLQLTFPPLRAGGPHWSHNAKQIIFDAEPPGEAQNVYTVSSQGGTPQRILPESTGLRRIKPVTWIGNSVIFRGRTGSPRQHPSEDVDLHLRSHVQARFYPCLIQMDSIPPLVAGRKVHRRP